MTDELTSPESGPVIESEIKTVTKMIELYCMKKHGTSKNTPCEDCQALLEYATLRLKHCRFQEDKPTCRKCKVHCYSPNMREKIKQVMRFSGPRLFLRAPVIWLRHSLHDIDEPSH